MPIDTKASAHAFMGLSQVACRRSQRKLTCKQNVPEGMAQVDRLLEKSYLSARLCTLTASSMRRI